jgi:tetratricopeptide (TPR) repeat protein
MFVVKQAHTLQRLLTRPAHVLVPALAGLLMLCAGFLPWLDYPLGDTFTGWQLSVDIGWQLHHHLFNYGLLCIVCALPAFAVASKHWRRTNQTETTFEREEWGKPGTYLACLCCLLPIALFLFQYVCVDIKSMSSLARQEIQMLSVTNLYDYRIPSQLVQLRPFEIDDSTFVERAVLLINQLAPGLIVPCVSAWLLLCCQIFSSPTSSAHFLTPTTRSHLRLSLILLSILAGVVLLSRPTGAMFCDYQARHALAVGDYTTATTWLDRAQALNPAFEQAPYYHIQRGQAEYFLHPTNLTTNGRIYLISVYLEQGNYLGAYQEIRTIRNLQPALPSWEADALNTALIRLAETTRTRNDRRSERSNLDAAILPWTQSMIQIDPSNVYAHYLAGRVYYDLHDFNQSTVQMTTILHLTHNMDLQSSAYTYIALSQLQQGKTANARKLLLKAVELDPEYSNNTAREELSGLH